MSFIQSLKDKSTLIVGGGLIYIAIAEYSSEVPYPWEVPGAGVVITAGGACVLWYLSALASSMSFYPTRTEFS